MFETTMTVVGNVTDVPQVKRTKSGHLVANFRVASTARRYDAELGQWVDHSTLFVTVSAWRTLAENVADCVRKGQPVVVTGRYYQREYTVDEQPRTTYELEATAIGHNLAYGVASFERGRRVEPAIERRPADETSGEVRELAAVG